MRRLNVLIACEESQRVCMAFRELGHNAFSCDIQEPSGEHPEWHILGDALKVLNPTEHCTVDGDVFKAIEFRTMDDQVHVVDRWDLIIAHPPCTYLTNASAVRMRKNGEIVRERYEKAMEAKEFFMSFIHADCDRICVENPVPLKIVQLPKYNQIIQPYQYGHPYSKRTCFWLKGLPELTPTDMITEGVTPYVNGGCKDAHGNYRRFQGRKERDPKTRSKTFPGIARAMAEQWSRYILEADG